MKILALLDYIRIIRPPNVIMVTSMVITGIWYSDPNFIWWKYIFASLVPITYIGIAMVHNDLEDLELDKINAPHRPLPSGRMSLKAAKLYAISLFIIGTTAGLWFGSGAIIIMFSTLVLSLLYNSKLKKTGFIGNIAVGITATSAFLYGDVVASGWKHFWPPSVWSPSIYLFYISAILNTSREVVKGIMDVTGDKLHDVKTIAVKYGKEKAAKIAILLVALAILIATVPLFTSTFGPIFVFAVLSFILLLLKTGIPLLRNPNYDTAKKFKNMLLPNMFLSLMLVTLDVIVSKYSDLYNNL
ncbi:MAG: UbiA family prenyltransferase [Candidatus Heimdallarchaeota archaeon]|nr:UbiA family prenyltransferase [Candidatus Heimdallarchaeota archaeon]